MNMKTRSFVIVCAAAALAMAVWAGLEVGPWGGAAYVQAQTGAVQYEADVAWPKPLPNRWVLGGLGGVCVDGQDHVLILNRQDVIEGDLNGARLAPPLIEFDPAGNVVNSWGDLKVMDPRLHSCHFDGEGNVWIAAAPSGMVQKYSHDGSKMLLQIGKKGVVDSSDGTIKGKPLNSNAALFFMPSSIFVDRGNGDVYVSDGEGANSNRRIAVMDKTGKFLRQWQPADMDVVHCMTIAKDGLVYVCNRTGSKIQIYDKMGNLKKTIDVPWAPVTPPADGKITQSGGAVVAIDFSPRSAAVVRHQSEQLADRGHRPPERAEGDELRASRDLPWSVQPGSRHRRRLEGERLRCREPRQAGSQVQAGQRSNVLAAITSHGTVVLEHEILRAVACLAELIFQRLGERDDARRIELSGRNQERHP